MLEPPPAGSHPPFGNGHMPEKCGPVVSMNIRHFRSLPFAKRVWAPPANLSPGRASATQEAPQCEIKVGDRSSTNTNSRNFRPPPLLVKHGPVRSNAIRALRLLLEAREAKERALETGMDALLQDLRSRSSHDSSIVEGVEVRRCDLSARFWYVGKPCHL